MKSPGFTFEENCGSRASMQCLPCSCGGRWLYICLRIRPVVMSACGDFQTFPVSFMWASLQVRQRAGYLALDRGCRNRGRRRQVNLAAGAHSPFEITGDRRDGDVARPEDASMQAGAGSAVRARYDRVCLVQGLDVAGRGRGFQHLARAWRHDETNVRM